MPKTTIVKCSLAAAACLLCAAYAVAGARDTLDVPAGKLISALKSLATQANVELVYQPEQLKDIQTDGVRGAYSPQEAIAILLKGTALRVYTAASGAMVIAPASTGPATDGDKQSAWARQDAGEIHLSRARADSPGSSPAVAGQEQDRKPGAARADDERTDAKLDEIVVTAQKQGEQSLQDVPISLSVISGKTLDSSRADGVLEALTAVPGLTMFVNQQTGGNTLSIRGVGAGSPEGPLFSGGTTVGYYLDEVPFGFVKTGLVPDAGGFDLERVEVLRGPRGSLYGASALNGVIRILTHDADLDAFDVKARASMSQTEDGGDNYRGDIAVNVPLVQGKLAARLVAGVNDIGGWIDKPNLGAGVEDVNDGKLSNYRLKINARPTEKLAIELGAWASRTEYGGVGVSSFDRTRPSPIPEPSETNFEAYNLNATYDFSSVSLTNALSYIDYDNLTVWDLGFAPIFTGFDATVFSEELRLASKRTEGWRWSLGGFYREAEDRLFQDLPPFLAVPVDFTDRSESFAFFGESTWGLSDTGLDLTLGLRYFSDRVEAIENQRFANDGRPLDYRQATFSAVTPRVVLTWRPSEDLTMYGSVAQGFRSGLHQYALVTAAFPDFPPTKEDTLWNYEIGAKAVLLDGRVEVESAVYRIVWRDIQQAIGADVGVADSQGNPVYATAPVNTGSGGGMGVDFALRVSPMERLDLGLNFAWNDVTLDQDVFSSGTRVFYQGSRLVNSPEYTAGVNGSYGFPIGASGYVGVIAAAAQYHSPMEGRGLSGGESFAIPADRILTSRLSLAVETPGHWKAMLFAENLNDERGAITGDPTSPGNLGARLRPRTVGVQLEYRLE